MNQILLNGINVNELLEKIAQLIDTKIGNFQQPTEKKQSTKQEPRITNDLNTLRKKNQQKRTRQQKSASFLALIPEQM